MPFIKVPLEYHSFSRIRKYVQLSGDQVAALPINAAILAAKESPRLGRLVTPSAIALERKLGWDGEAGRGVDSLIKAGVLEEAEDGYVFLGWERTWDEEQGHILKFQEKARKAAKALWQRVTVDA